MATGTRIRQDFIEGTLTNALGAGATPDTTMDSNGLADLVAIDHATNGEYAAVVVGDEILHVTAHTAGATTATVQRGQEGTAIAAHDAGAAWHHGPTEDDFTELASSSGGGGRTLIEEQVKSATGNFTFTVPTGYTSLVIEARLRSTLADSNEVVSVRFNGDTASNYSWEYGRGDGTNWAAAQADAAQMWGGWAPAANAPAGSFGHHEYSILDYLDTNYQAVMSGKGGAFWVNRVVWVHSGLWKNTAALTSIDIFCASGFAAGSKARLYGMS